MSTSGRLCSSYQPGYLNGQASWFSSGPPPPWDVKSPPPWHVKCLKEMVILLGVLCRNGPIKRFLSVTLISLTWSCHPFEDSWPCSFPLLLISGSVRLSGLWISSLISVNQTRSHQRVRQSGGILGERPPSVKDLVGGNKWECQALCLPLDLPLLPYLHHLLGLARCRSWAVYRILWN